MRMHERGVCYGGSILPARLEFCDEGRLVSATRQPTPERENVNP
jgi:hypothetical protein